MQKTNMKEYGLVGSFSAEAASFPDLFAGRVITQSKDLYKVVCENGELTAEVSGRFRFGAKALSDYPAVGDFVMLDRNTGTEGNGIIHHVLTRKSAFIRKAAGTGQDDQIVASNIDKVFICMSLNNDFNVRRLERYLAIGWDSRATPVVVLTKADLCDDIAGRLAEAEAVAIGAEVLVTSGVGNGDFLPVKNHILPGETAAFIGSSGVGKSTLINRLVGEDRYDTQGIRDDDKGRHTTTRRELILLAGGGMVIDTPGMRELGIESADLSRTFADIDELSSRCKFHDCTHKNEPGCQVQNAIREGALSAERLASYQKLKKEVKYDGLNSRQIEHEKLSEMFSQVGGMKNARKFLKEKDKRR